MKPHHGHLVRQSGLTAVAAAAAVVAGLLLDASIAAHFGAGPATDAFFVAARVPLGAIAIVVVAANQALVPTFSTWMVRKTEAETHHLVSLIFTGTLLGTMVLALGAGMIAEPLMHLTAPGLRDAEAALAASIARIMLLLFPLVSMAEVLRAYLNSRRSSAAPIGLHAVMNGLAAGIVVVFAGVDIHLVAWAYVAGAVGQLALLAMMCGRRRFRFVPSLAFGDPELRATGRLSVRPMLGAGLNPAARMCEQLVVSFLPSGSITILNYGYRLISAIGGSVFFRSVIVALLPRLTEATARREEEEVARVASLGLQIMLVISVPLTVFMAILAEPTVSALFRRGSFSKADASLLAVVLAVYAASLVGSAAQRALLAPFYARLDTRTPFRNTFYGVVTNVGLLAVTVLPFRHSARAPVIGVAVAYSLAQYVNMTHAWLRLRTLISRPLTGSAALLGRLGAASLLSAATMSGIYRLYDLGAPAPASVQLFKVTVTAIAGLAVLGVTLGAVAGPKVRRTLWATATAGLK